MAYTGGSALMPWVGERLELQVATSTFPSAEVKVRWDLHRWPVINSCAFDGLLWKEATYSHSSLGSFGWANPSVGHVQGSNWFRRAAATGGWLQTRAVVEPGTETKKHQKSSSPKHPVAQDTQSSLSSPGANTGSSQRHSTNININSSIYAFSRSQILRQKTLTKINELIFQSSSFFFLKIQIMWFFN